MDLPEELDFPRPSIEEKYHRAVPGYMKRIRDLYEAVHDRFGDEGLELIRDVSKEYGTRIAENVSKKEQLRGVSQVGRYLLKVFDMVSDDLEVTESSDERLVIKVRRCPYPFRTEAVCRAHTCMEHALIEGLDPRLVHRVESCIPAGDDFCEHVVTKK